MATFSGVENFDSYTSGVALNTSGSGGSGWAAAWVKDAGSGASLFTPTNTQFVSSPNGCLCTQTFGSGEFSRVPTTVPSGNSTIIHASLRLASSASAGNGYVGFGTETAASGGVGYYQIRIRDDGVCEIVVAGGTGVTVATGLSLNTWYHVYIDIDATNQKARGYVSTTIPNAPITWSSYTGAGTGASFGFFWVEAVANSAGLTTTGYIDDIRDVGTDMTTTSVFSKSRKVFQAVNRAATY
jgi:hypothetical protein